MKRIGILSDTHGYLEDIDLVLEATADQDIDMWLHAGDFGDDARYMQEHTDIPVYAVWAWRFGYRSDYRLYLCLVHDFSVY